MEGGRSMKRLTVGSAALNQTPLDWPGNKANIIEALSQGRVQGVSIICLPELAISGYGLEDTMNWPWVATRSWRYLQNVLPHTKGLVAAIGLPINYNRKTYNAAVIVVDTKIVGIYCKQVLAGDGVQYEPRTTTAWPQGKVGRFYAEELAAPIPIGDFSLVVDGVVIDIAICAQLWERNRAGEGDIVLSPNASYAAMGKLETREALIRDGSRATNSVYVYANLVGNESGRIVYDGDCYIAQCGKILARNDLLSYKNVNVIAATVNVEVGRLEAARRVGYQTEVEVNPRQIRVDWFQFPDKPRTALANVELPAWAKSNFSRFEEFTRIVALALFDDLRKTKTNGFLISLSGGADSGSAAVLVTAMVLLAIQELGLDGFKAKLSHIEALQKVRSAQGAVKVLLHCVYQKAEGSTWKSFFAARSLAKSLGATFYHWDVSPIVTLYTRMVSKVLGRKLTWKRDDLALQNIQARVRAPGPWMLANILNLLFLNTSNRSEADVGYSTLDGDTCGSRNPIGGIDKEFLLDWLEWAYKIGPAGLGRFLGLERVYNMTPSAELRKGGGQTDEKELMPFPVLKMLETMAIGQGMDPTEILEELAANPFFAKQWDKAKLGDWISKFFRLWAKAQTKRDRQAPAYHVDDLNVDPRSWCRFPLLNGGFVEEIEEMLERFDDMRLAA